MNANGPRLRHFFDEQTCQCNHVIGSGAAVVVNPEWCKSVNPVVMVHEPGRLETKRFREHARILVGFPHADLDLALRRQCEAAKVMIVIKLPLYGLALIGAQCFEYKRFRLTCPRSTDRPAP